MGWAVTVGLTSRRFQLDLPFVINFRRLAELLSVGAVLGFLLFGSGITGMTAQIVVNTTIGFWLLYRSRSYWPITLAGLLLLPAIFLAELKLWFTIWPEFAENWNSASPWGWTIAGIPLGEFAFYLTFSIVSPASVAYCRGAVISPRQNISTLLTLDSGHEPH
jgi:hypothetical protein